MVAGFLMVQAGTAWVGAAVPLVRAEAGAETLDAWRQDFQRSPVAERFGRLTFDLAEQNATIVCDWEQATVLWYLQRVENMRPDLTIRYPIETLDDVLAQTAGTGRAVYLSRTLPGVESRGVISSVGPLLRVMPPPDTALPSSATPYDVRFEGGVSLAGVTTHATSLHSGGVLPLTLHWRADTPVAEDYAVSVRLLRPNGDVLAQHDERHPALGTSSTRAWRVGEVVGDYHELPLGSRLEPGPYQVKVVPYRVEPRHELRQLNAQGEPTEAGATLAPITVERRPFSRPLNLLVRLILR
jgi:hypothetical protein